MSHRRERLLTEEPKPRSEVSAGDVALNVGATVRPRYGQRTPKMYHLFENEVISVSSLNAIALSFFSIGGFLASCVITILIGYTYASQPLTEFGTFMCRRGAFGVGLLAAFFYGFGAWMVIARRSMIERIKEETVSEQTVR